jgi:hypothetical protein
MHRRSKKISLSQKGSCTETNQGTKAQQIYHESLSYTQQEMEKDAGTLEEQGGNIYPCRNSPDLGGSAAIALRIGVGIEEEAVPHYGPAVAVEAGALRGWGRGGAHPCCLHAEVGRLVSRPG